MPIVIADRVKVTTTTTGTGTLTLGAAATGFQDFGVIGDGNETYYTISVPGGVDYEVGIGTFTASGATLSRDTILDSSNGGSAVNFSAGTKDVFVTYPSGRSVYVAGSTIVAENSAVLPIASGGTGQTTYTNGQLLIGNTTGNTLTKATLTGTANRLLVTNGTGSITLNVDATNANTANKVVARDASGNFSAGTITAALSGNATTSSSTTGNAATATALQTARTIGGVSFNGTANINLPGVNTAGNQNTSGNAATATALQNARTIGGVSFNGTANINLPGVNTAGNQNTTGSAASLTTARTIGGVSFNGTANINLPGVNTAGNQNTTGSAASLTTARAINGTNFNGTAAITTANWGTSRNLSIGGTSKAVNGSVNVTWTSAEITAGKLSTASGTAPSYSARAWVNFNGTGTVAIRASGNVSSITDNGVGLYTANFSTALPDANYAVAGAIQRGSSDSNGDFSLPLSGTYSTTAVQVGARSTTNVSVFIDAVQVCMVAFR